MNLFLRQALLLLPFLTAAAYPPPEPCSGWCFKDIRDPNVVFRDGTYYRFATNANFTIATAPSMAGPWKKQGSVLDNGTMINLPLRHPTTEGNGKKKHRPANPSMWAPDVQLMGDTYWLTYAVTRGGRVSDIGVATSKTLEPGSWTDFGSIGVPQTEHLNRIDSNLLRPSPGEQPILAFGSYSRGLYQMPLDLQDKKVVGEPKLIVHNATNDAIEAAYQFQWEAKDKTWYYLFFSSGRCCNPVEHLPEPGLEYKVMVCRSDSPTGPFVDDNDTPCLKSGGKMVLESHDDVYATGGQGVMWDEMLHSPIMYYHYMNKSTGYKVGDVWFGYNKLSFESGWPVLVTADGGEATVGGSDEGSGGDGNGSSAAGDGTKSAAVQTVATTGSLVVFLFALALGVLGSLQ